ncbi:MAG: hypothetical protein V3S11_01040 [Elusimicrobiota bacterium]
MRLKLLYALISSSVVAGTSWTMSTVALDVLPKGALRETAQRYVLAPGSELLELLEDQKSIRKLRKKGRKRIKKSKKKFDQKLDKAADKLDDVLSEYEIGEEISDRLSGEAKRLEKLYNVGIWALAGFALCALFTMILGVSSLKTAVALGAKVTLLMIFLQGALVFGGILVVQRLAG